MMEVLFVVMSLLMIYAYWSYLKEMKEKLKDLDP